MDKITHLLKAIGGSAISGVAAWLLSTGAMDSVHAVLPSSPLWLIGGAFLGTILHGAGTSLQSFAALLSAE